MVCACFAASVRKPQEQEGADSRGVAVGEGRIARPARRKAARIILWVYQA